MGAVNSSQEREILQKLFTILIIRSKKRPKIIKKAGVVKLVDKPDLGYGAARFESTSLPTRTFLKTF